MTNGSLRLLRQAQASMTKLVESFFRVGQCKRHITITALCSKLVTAASDDDILFAVDFVSSCGSKTRSGRSVSHKRFSCSLIECTELFIFSCGNDLLFPGAMTAYTILPIQCRPGCPKVPVDVQHLYQTFGVSTQFHLIIIEQ